MAGKPFSYLFMCSVSPPLDCQTKGSVSSTMSTHSASTADVQPWLDELVEIFLVCPLLPLACMCTGDTFIQHITTEHP